MTKAELINHVADKVKDVSKKDIAEVYDHIFEAIAKSLEVEKRFQASGFGTFEVRERKAREGRNPRTGDPVKIEASKTVGFKASPSLKERMNKKSGKKK